MRFSRSLRSLHSDNDNVEILLMWMPGKDNPSDLASKIHENVSHILNSSFWRKGSELYLRPEFPAISEGIIYAQLKDEKFTHFGLPNTAQHLTVFNHCSSVVETGGLIADQLVTQTQLLCFNTSTTDRKSAVHPDSAARDYFVT